MPPARHFCAGGELPAPPIVDSVAPYLQVIRSRARPAREPRETPLSRFINVRRVGAVEIVTLNRPEVMNAWHMPMRNELLKALGVARKSRDVGAIVLTGTGKSRFAPGRISTKHASSIPRAPSYGSRDGGFCMKPYAGSTYPSCAR